MLITSVQRPLGERARRFLFTHREENGGSQALRDFDQLLAHADLLARALSDPNTLEARDTLVSYRFARGVKQ